MIAFQKRFFSRLSDKDLGKRMYYNAFSAQAKCCFIQVITLRNRCLIPPWPALGLWPWTCKPANRLWPLPQFCCSLGEINWGMQFHMLLVFHGVLFLVWFTDVQTLMIGMFTKWEIGNKRIAGLTGPPVGNTADLFLPLISFRISSPPAGLAQALNGEEGKTTWCRPAQYFALIDFGVEHDACPFNSNVSFYLKKAFSAGTVSNLGSVSLETLCSLHGYPVCGKQGAWSLQRQHTHVHIASCSALKRAALLCIQMLLHHNNSF